MVNFQTRTMEVDSDGETVSSAISLRRPPTDDALSMEKAFNPNRSNQDSIDMTKDVDPNTLLQRILILQMTLLK